MQNFRRIIISALYFIIFISKVLATNYASPDSFRFEGRVVSNESPVPAVILNLYLDGKRIKQLLTTRQGTFVLYLKYKKEYVLELVKKGYFIQKIVIDTKVSDKLLKEGGIDVAIDNDIPLFEIFPDIKPDMFDKPLLYYVYNERNYYFEVDRRRSKPITGLYGQIKGIKNRTANAELKEALNYIKSKNYVQAYLTLKKTLELSPTNQQANIKLKEVEELLKGGDSLRIYYNELISRADGLRKSKKYFQAQELYKRALLLYPKDFYAANYVHHIDSILSYQYSEKKDEFDILRSKGDAAFRAGQFNDALEHYTNALEIIPDDVYVNKQIVNVKKSIESERKKKEQDEKIRISKYNQLLSEAANQRQKKNYEEALKLYQQALILNYNNEEIRRLIDETNLAIKQEQILRNYNDTLKLADKAFENKEYQRAMDLYKAANRIKPDELYPNQQVEKIKSIQRSASQRLAEKKEENRKSTLSNRKDASIFNLIKLLNSYHTQKHVEEKAILGQKIAMIYLELQKADSALIYFYLALEEARKSKQMSIQIGILEGIAAAHFYEGNYWKGIEAVDAAIEISQALKDTAQTIRLLKLQAQNLMNTFQYDRAILYIDRTIEISRIKGDTALLTELYSDKGDIYHLQNQYQQAVEQYLKALRIAEMTDDRKQQSLLRNNLGVLFFKMGDLEAALAEFNKAIKIGRSSRNIREVSLSYNNIGNIHFAQQEYLKALDFYNKSIKIKEEIDFQTGISVTLYNIGTAYLELKKLTEANIYLQKSIDISKKYRFIELMQQSYLTLAKVHELSNDFREAVKAYKEYAAIAITPVSIESPVFETSFLYGKPNNQSSFLRKELFRQKILADNRALINRQKEQELMIKEMELQQQRSKVVRFRSLFLFSILSVILLSILSFQIYKRYREKRMLSEMIGFQKQQLTDSITYASRIQQAIMPPEDVVSAYFKDYFILNIPKDIVTGDYFFVAEVEGKVYVAVADCTGHGVPGAFMSILGISLTKEIILMQQRSLHANEVLDQLRISLINALHQQGREDEAKDGIDIALCVIDRNSGKLEYSGANNPAFIIRGGKLIELKANRMPIGIHPILHSFDAHVLEIADGDVIYLFSDGYRDQIGEETLKKFRRDEFARLLLSIHTLPMSNQKEILYQRHLQWKGSLEQTDDILIMGLKV
ncbi:MAG: tetratricopeptide repeat protein [Bacteroidales bacterium]|nr:tetratricopeptide repeat protein [Bacteroidales bacterium]